jgi:hypothetical protein
VEEIPPEEVEWVQFTIREVSQTHIVTATISTLDGEIEGADNTHHITADCLFAVPIDSEAGNRLRCSPILEPLIVNGTKPK